MTDLVNRRIVLAARPVGEPKPSDFRLETAPVPEPQAGQFVARAVYLSLDPYMRGRMSAAKSYVRPVELGETLAGGTVSQVIASQHPEFPHGSFVVGYGGWQDYALSNGTGVRRLDPAAAPLSTALGVLGMPGHTAYVGLLDIGRPKADETVVVSAASGAVGQVVGQIAKIKGCRVVGVAGSPEKCAFVVDELGFDACVSHRSPRLAEDLRDACPSGIDVYFESVGGRVFEAVLPLMAVYGRIAVCGTIAAYNMTELPPGPDRTPLALRAILVNRLRVEGFIIFDHEHRAAAAFADIGRWMREGRIKYRETFIDGLENAPAGLVALMRGDHLGKMLVRVSEESTRPAG